MANKFEKNSNCEYCGKELKAKYRSKRFCDDKCRIYLKREQEGTGLKTVGFTKDGEELKMYVPAGVGGEKKKITIPYYASNDKIVGLTPPIPTRNEGESAIDFAARKNEWKKLYGS